MKKRIFLPLVVLIASLLLVSFAACGGNSGSNNDQPLDPPLDVVETDNLVFTYNKSTGTYSVTLAESAADIESITVPGKINGYTVTSIADYSFIRNATLKEIIIEEGVTQIGMSAFNSCTALTTVTLPETLRSIKRSAFSGCTALNRIDIPDQVISMEDGCFSGCTSLSIANIPSELRSISANLFSATAIQSAIMPAGIMKIGANSFSGCKNLSEVKLNQQLAEIGAYAFSGCSALEEILFPRNGSLIIGDYAFSESGLKKVYIPENVTLGTYTFMKLAWDDSVPNPGEPSSPGASGCTAVYYESEFGSRGVNVFGYTWNRPDLGFRIYIPKGSMSYYQSENPGDEAWVRCVVNSVNSMDGIYNVLEEYDIDEVFPDGFPVAE